MSAVTKLNSAVSRRRFLQSLGITGGGLILGVSSNGPYPVDAAPASFAPNAFVHIAHDGMVTLTMPYVEMGQGTYTSVSMLIAEELEVDPKKVKLEHAPADDSRFANPIMGAQETDGSLTMRGAWIPMRQAGAAARIMLVRAAAARWKVPERDCVASDGHVEHAQTKRGIGYGELVDAASKLPIPTELRLKPPEEFKLVGRPLKRLDAMAKVKGEAQFGIDVRLPRMKIAAVSASPVLGGKVATVDESAARQVKGVHDIVRIDDAVAVIGEHWAAAKKGLDALVITWDDGPNADFSTTKLASDLLAASESKGVLAAETGNEEATFQQASRKLEAIYELPVLAHAPMEPLNCTAQVTSERCDLWYGSQASTRAQSAVAAALGMKRENVFVHNQYLGGSFGRRAEADNAVQAALIARQLDYPVKIIWSREEDTQHDFYRPYYLDRMRASLGKDGKIESWFHRVVGASPLARWLPPAIHNGLDPDAVTSASGPYQFPNLYVDFVRQEVAAFHTGFWRGVGTTHNAFMVEGFMDELAILAGEDPLAFRLKHLKADPRLKLVLETIAKRSEWGSALPKGTGRGVSLLQDFGGTILAHVAEVAVDDQAVVMVKRVTSVVDCGQVVNPDTVMAQIQGGTIFGISAALYGEITFANGRVEQANFDTYRAVRIDAAPTVDVHILHSGTEPFGVGESGTSGIMPAIANAVFAATGKRIRKLPISPAALRQ